MPTDAQFITGEVPDQMRQGVEIDRESVAQPTRIIDDLDGQPAQLTQHRFPRPATISAGPPSWKGEAAQLLSPVSPAQMSYDFPLLPGVQCRVTLQVLTGELRADHLEQLVSLLTSHCTKLREQEARNAEIRKIIPTSEDILKRALNEQPKRGRPKKAEMLPVRLEEPDGTER